MSKVAEGSTGANLDGEEQSETQDGTEESKKVGLKREAGEG